MIRIYIAAPYARADIANALALELRERSFDVCSTWHYAAAGPEVLDADVAAFAIAENDRDLAECHAVLCMAWKGQGGEMFAELTRALMAGRPVYWVSIDGRDVLSAWRPGVVRCEGLTDALNRMAAELGGQEG